MEVLFQVEGSKRVLTFTSVDSLRQQILDILSMLDPHACIFEPGSGNKALAPGNHYYLPQRWSPKWNEFVDVRLSDIQAGDRVTAVPKPTVNVEKDREKVEEVCHKAIDVCKKVGKPTQEDRKILRKLFPSIGSSSSFNPKKASCAEVNKAKKKAAISGKGGKSRTITAVLFKNLPSTVPKGSSRKRLSNEGRVTKIKIKRSMSSSEVKAVIATSFSSFHKFKDFKFVKCDKTNKLEVLSTSQLNGDETAKLAGGGSLYLLENDTLSDPTSSASGAVSDNGSMYSPTYSPLPSSEESDDSEVEFVAYEKPINEPTSPIEPTNAPTLLDEIYAVPEEPQTESPASSSAGVDTTLEARRDLVGEQDAQYQRSLQIDQEKDAQKAKERAREEKFQLIRSDLAPKFSADISGGISLAFRLPSGKRVERQFATTSQVKDIYDYVFAVELVKPPFSLFFSFPRSKIPASDGLLQDLITEPASLITVESPGDYDPIGNGSESQVSTPAMVCNADSFIVTLHQAQKERERFMTGLEFPIGRHHIVRRNNVYCDVMKLYETEELKEFPFKIKFDGEIAMDFGGVTRDLFSAFFKEMYCKFFDGTCLVTPAIHPGTDLDKLPVLGFIISHAYLVSGVLPVRIAFPCLAGILSNVSGLPEEVLLSAFIDSLSIHDAKVVIKALKQVKDDFESFSADVSCDLQLVLSFYQIREIPRPATLARILLQIAVCEFKTKPAAAIQAIRSGIPEDHKPFWKNTSISTFYSIYKALSVSTDKVLKLLQEVITTNPSEERVLSYLRQYIGNMRVDELRVFLRFVTGSCVCTASGINVAFNGLEGLARRPLVHTCSCTIELPTTYFNYADFSSEFEAVLNSEEQSWSMNAI